MLFAVLILNFVSYKYLIKTVKQLAGNQVQFWHVPFEQYYLTGFSMMEILKVKEFTCTYILGLSKKKNCSIAGVNFLNLTWENFLYPMWEPLFLVFEPFLNLVWESFLNLVWKSFLNHVWKPFLNPIWEPSMNPVWKSFLNPVWEPFLSLLWEPFLVQPFE